MKSPCKGCEYRVLGCHSTCAAYAKYSSNRKEEIETRYIRGDVYGYVKDSNNRIKRRIGKCQEGAKKKVHIWGLFDDGNGCYRQGLDEYNVNMGGNTRSHQQASVMRVSTKTLQLIRYINQTHYGNSWISQIDLMLFQLVHHVKVGVQQVR